MMRRSLLLLLLLAAVSLGHAQEQDTDTLAVPDTLAADAPLPEAEAIRLPDDTAVIRQYINLLCSRGFYGRGYVGRGMQKAARYIAGQYKAIGLKPFSEGYAQSFTYPVNTFPGVLNVRVENRTLQPEKDYLVHPASNGFDGEELKVRVIDGAAFAAKVRSRRKAGAALKEWQRLRRNISSVKYTYLLEHTDSICAAMQWDREQELLEQLPEGAFWVRRRGKPTWSVADRAMAATVIELFDSTWVPEKKSRASVTLVNRFEPKFKAENVIGYVPGTLYPDSFIVITAHFDHLGKMGSRTYFPGASDNASGTAMLLNLAQYYAAHPQRYSIAFIAFAGEEAGLRGSAWYTEHPLFPLEQIRFLLNLDILGDATDGITVVNGTLHRDQFELLNQLNQANRYLPAIKPRDKAANSDHYFFSEKGVPAFFIYTNGGKGYYHDTADRPEHVTLASITGLAALLKQWISGLQ